MPASSGTAAAPIHFGSYGTGRAQLNMTTGNDVWIPDGRHDLSFDNLDFTGSSVLFASSASGPGTYDITITNAVFHDTPFSAVNVATANDHNWTISGSTIRHTGDSGLIIWGSNVSVTDSTITDTGWNTSLSWAKHGIYDKGVNTTIANNDFSNIPNGQAVSIRMHGARIYGNTIHDTPYAIAFFDYDTSAIPQGTSYVYDNRLWNITGWGFYYAGGADPQDNPPTVNFVVASNTFAFANATEAVNVSEVPSVAAVTLANNVFTGSYGSSYRGCATCSEYNNDWYGGTSNLPNGNGDQHVAPALSAAPNLAPSSSSPIVDAGTTNVTGITYTPNCDGAPMDYCGASPDQGAVESLSGSSSPPAPAPTPAPTPAPAPAPTPAPAPAPTPAPTPAPAPAPAPSTPDTTAPTAPGTPSFTATQTGGTLAWSAATDNVGVAGYGVSVNGTELASTVSRSYTVTGLTCGTSYTLGVTAYDAAGNASSPVTLAAQTSACTTTTTTTTSSSSTARHQKRAHNRLATSSGGSPSSTAPTTAVVSQQPGGSNAPAVAHVAAAPFGGVTSVKTLKSGATLTTYASGRQVEQTKGKTPYVVEA